MSMKIPIFEEIRLNDTNVDQLRLLVSESRIGAVPSYLNIGNLKKEERDLLILNLEQVILEYGIHPMFPYPLYLVSTNPVKSIFPSVRSVKELPEHFFKKVKRPNNKELQLLNKLSLKVNKIKNLELYKIISTFKSSSASQKELYNETKELYFLEMLSSRIFEKQKKQ